MCRFRKEAPEKGEVAMKQADCPCSTRSQNSRVPVGNSLFRCPPQLRNWQGCLSKRLVWLFLVTHGTRALIVSSSPYLGLSATATSIRVFRAIGLLLALFPSFIRPRWSLTEVYSLWELPTATLRCKMFPAQTSRDQMLPSFLQALQ